MAAHQNTGEKNSALTWFEGEWHREPVRIMDAVAPGSWLGSNVFDGARYFDGVAPDLDRHCQRAIASAKILGLSPKISALDMEALAWEGIAMCPPERALYIRPMFFAGAGFLIPDPDHTEFVLVLEDMPMPPVKGFSACLSSFRRPLPEAAPTEAKAGCLYPNVSRCLREAAEKGFENAVVLDPWDNVAEFASANLMLVKDGIMHTPETNGTFLNGITRQRLISLLREAGFDVLERVIKFEEVLDADEVFATGNYAKIMPASQIEDRFYQPGPITQTARTLYFEWAMTQIRP